MPRKTKTKVEYGDFQTPDYLCSRICKLLRDLKVSPNSIVEPTCGKGSFLRATADAFPECNRILGFEINPEYVMISRSIERASIYCEDFFRMDWQAVLSQLEEPILVIGNPPWVTSSTVGSLSGNNLPRKSNFQSFNGFDALTGKSNFDISEWMLIHILEWLSGRSAVVAMLCKTTVARKVLRYAWNKHIEIQQSTIYLIDAIEHFGASVDACLLICKLKPSASDHQCKVYQDLSTNAPNSTVAFRSGRLISNLTKFVKYEHLYQRSSIRWRSGIKHDCSRVMELIPQGLNSYINGFGDHVSLESTYLYPMLKSSELMKPSPISSRYMLVTQQNIGEDTSELEKKAPQTWQYLIKYANYLDKRSSSIYRNRPRFSVFGVGHYSFAPWKIAISGFYKILQFRIVGPLDKKSVVLDDTCYFLPCQTESEARILFELVNSKIAREFYSSQIFWDMKRPITADVLGCLNFEVLSTELGISLPKHANNQI